MIADTKNVPVKYGKPIIFISFRSLIVLCLIETLLNVSIIVYCLELLNIAIRIKLKLGDYIDLFMEKGFVLPTMLSSAALICLSINVFNIFILQRIFNSTIKVLDCILFITLILNALILIFLIMFLIWTISYGYEYNPDDVQSFLEAIGNYSTDGETKLEIDKLQFEFQCCGGRNYTDWFNVRWYDQNFARKSEVRVIGEAPYSCCSIASAFPCVHHGIEQGSGAYSYTPDANFSLNINGCFKVLTSRKKETAWSVVGYISILFVIQFVVLIPMRFIQTAHLDRGKFDKENYLYPAWLIGCYVGKKQKTGSNYNNDRKHKKAPPIPPIPPELLYCCTKK